MTKFFRYFLGDTLYDMTSDGLKWFVGISPDPQTDDDFYLEEIARSLEDAQLELDNIRSSVERVRLVAQEVQDRYRRKCQSHQELLDLSLASQHQGDLPAARAAMAQAIQIERELPELQKRAEDSQQMAIGIEEIYAQKASDLSLLAIDLKISMAQKEVNASLGSDGCGDLNAIQARLGRVRSEIEDRYQQILAEIELSDSSNCRLGKSLSTDEIDERLAELNDNDID